MAKKKATKHTREFARDGMVYKSPSVATDNDINLTSSNKIKPYP